MNSMFEHNLGLTNDLSDIGRALVGHSRESVNIKRGKVDELFPYILLASETMSARSISHWLEEKKNLKLSAASVAKAIREKGRYLERIYLRVKPGADYLANISAFDADEILLSKRESGARNAIYEEYAGKLNSTKEDKERSDQLLIGIRMLTEWDVLPDEIRELCIKTCINNTEGGQT